MNNTSDIDNKLKEKLLKYFENEDKLIILYNVLKKKSVYSLRVLEWFVTNYCKKHLVVYKVNGIQFNVYKKYKDNLKSYSKERFDPFKRTKVSENLSSKIKLKTKSGDVFETSICQMNFFKWMITNNIHNYVEKNIKLIKEDMNKSNNNKDKDTKISKKNKDTNKLSSSKISQTDNKSSSIKKKKEYIEQLPLNKKSTPIPSIKKHKKTIVNNTKKIVKSFD